MPGSTESPEGEPPSPERVIEVETCGAEEEEDGKVGGVVGEIPVRVEAEGKMELGAKLPIGGEEKEEGLYSSTMSE